MSFSSSKNWHGVVLQLKSRVERVLLLRQHLDWETVHKFADLRAEVSIDFEVPGYKTTVITVSPVVQTS